MLVAIEGLDFSGKTTLCNMLSRGIEVEIHDDSRIISEARQRVYNLEHMYKAFDRTDDPLENHYRRNLSILGEYRDRLFFDETWDDQTIAISDRFKTSFLVYGLAMYPERAMEVISKYDDLNDKYVPMLEIILDISREEWLKRSVGKELDRYEKFVSEHFDMMREYYIQYEQYLANDSDQEVVIIDVDALTPEQVYNATVRSIWDHYCMKDVDTRPVML